MMHEFEDRDDPKPPHPWRNFALMTGATIAVVFLIVNVIRGLTGHGWNWRSEEHTSELQSLMRISYAVFCLKKKNIHLCILHETYLDIHHISTYYDLHSHSSLTPSL